MRRPGFIEGVLVALAAAFGGTVVHGLLSVLLAEGLAVRLIVAAAALGYIVYLLSRSRERIGRVTLVLVWLIVTGVGWLMAPSLTGFVLMQTALIWVTRSLYFYSSPLWALADLGLNALSLAAALWALLQTGSLFAPLWLFFLTQALFTVIPAGIGGKAKKPALGRPGPDRFQQAYRSAQAAVNNIEKQQENLI